MILLLAVMPIIGWGIMPIVAKKIDGSPQESMLGTTIMVSIVMGSYSWWNSFSYDLPFSMICLCSGILWGIGQWLQFEAIDRIDVSKAMPLSNGSQLIFTSVISWVILGEWFSNWRGVSELVCLLVMLFGIYLVTKTQNGTEGKVSLSAVGLICLSSLALTGYVSITKLFELSGSEIFFPQSIGMLLTAISLNLKSDRPIKVVHVRKNLWTGFWWLIANSSLFYISEKIGLGLSFSVSQLCVIVAVLGGIVILKDQKTQWEKRNLFVGVPLMVISILFLGIIKSY